MAKFIKNFRPTNYAADLVGTGVSGNIAVSGDMKLVQINCSIEGLGTFDAYGPDVAAPNLHPAGWEKGEALAARAKEIVDSVNAELAAI